MRTLWFMGVKSRLIPEFIEGAVNDMLPDGGTVLDLFAGTGIVGRSLAGNYRIFSNDVQAFSSVLAQAHLEGGKEWFQALDHLDPESDLQRNYDRNWEHLQPLLGAALHKERELLPQVLAKNAQSYQIYRDFLEACPSPSDHEELDKNQSPTVLESLFKPIAGLYKGFLKERRANPELAPYAMASLYFQSVYFGLEQCMQIDSLRFAIDQISEQDPHRKAKQKLYTAALVYAASISTSGTSHFAQPRSVRKDSELIAVAKRRSLDFEAEFYRALDGIRREWTQRCEGNEVYDNQVFNSPAEVLLEADGPLAKDTPDLIYMDPPYTADHYSRFYHVLETLVNYNYPEFQMQRGEVTRGLYPLIEHRFQSDFCKRQRVEDSFRDIAKKAAQLGSRLLVSYSEDSGLLLKYWAEQGETEPLKRFHLLFRDYFEKVEIRDRFLMHSGQGDSNIKIREILVLCEQPKKQ